MNALDKKNPILIVDDEEDIRDVLRMSLSSSGFTVHVAENGAEAWRLYQEVRPPLVLTDIKMPGMDGIQLLRKIKQENPDTQVIMITGHGDMEVAIESFKDDAADFITKPIDFDSLETALKHAREKLTIQHKLRDYTESLEALLARKIQNLAEATERLADTRLLQEAVSAGDGHFQEIVDQMPCYIALQDRRFRYTAANHAFKEDFRWETGAVCYQLCMQRGEPCDDCPVVKTFADGQSHQGEMKLVSKSARHYYVFVWTAPIQDATGKINHVLVMLMDIQRILQRQDQLSSLGLLVGSVSHGLKGLLTGMDGGLYLIDSGLARKDDEKIREGVAIVRLMSQRIKSKVLDLLFYAKDRELKKEAVIVSSFVEELSLVVENKARNLNILFVRRFSALPAQMEMDPSAVRSALMNILENAVDACEADKRKAAHCIEFSIRNEEDDVVFEIRDNGIGMDRETRENIFNLFFSTKEKKGTGLGMYIANKVFRQHGGQIQVNSTPGQGTCLTARLPVRNPAGQGA